MIALGPREARRRTGAGRRSSLVLLCLLATAAWSQAGAATPKHPYNLKPPPLAFTPREVERGTLANGIPVLLDENHELPILDLTIQFRMGRRFLPIGRHAACRLLSSLWRQGGTRSIPPDSLDELLTALDASVSTSAGARVGAVSVSLSSEDAERALPIWRDIVLFPRFDGDRMSRAKANRLKVLQGINNDPEAIADTRCNWLLLGPDHPAARLESRAEIDAVTEADLHDLHARFVRPENAVLGVSGDFDRRSMLALLNRLFREWPVSGPYTPPAPEDWTPHPEPGVYLLRGDYEQSQVRMGRVIPDLTEDSADRAAAALLSYALGYGRVFYRVRAEGLSYGAAVMLSAGEDWGELWSFGSCRGDATLPTLRAIIDETRGLETRPLTEKELESSRLFQIGGEVRSNETAAALVFRQVDAQVRGKPDDFHARYLEGLKRATTGDLARVATRYVNTPDSVVVLVLGNPDEFQAPLDSLGLGPVKALEPMVFGE